MMEICYLFFRLDPSLAASSATAQIDRQVRLVEVDQAVEKASQRSCPNRQWPGTEVAVRCLYGPLSLPAGAYAKCGSDRGLGLIWKFLGTSS